MPTPESPHSQAENQPRSIDDQNSRLSDQGDRNKAFLDKAGIDTPSKPTETDIAFLAKETLISELPQDLQDMIEQDRDPKQRQALAISGQVKAFASMKNPQESFNKIEEKMRERFNNTKASPRDREDMELFVSRKPNESEIA